MIGVGLLCVPLTVKSDIITTNSQPAIFNLQMLSDLNEHRGLQNIKDCVCYLEISVCIVLAYCL